MPKKKIVKITPPVIGSDDSELQKVTEQVLNIKNDAGWDLPVKSKKILAGDLLTEWIESKENQRDICKVELGFGYAAKKRELGHGLFESWIKETGRSSRSVRSAMQIAQLLHSLSNQNAKLAAKMPQRKLTVLASATPEIVNDLLNSNEITEDMSREELREIIDLNKKVATLSQRLDTAEISNTDLKKRLKNKQRSSPYPEFVATTRHESTALMDKASLCFDDTEKLYQQLEDLGRKGDAEHKRNWNIAASSLYHNLRSTIAKAEKFLTELDSSLPKDVRGPASPSYYFNETEVLEVIQERELLLEQHQHESIMRKTERDIKKPKGRGRPAKG